VQYFSRRIHVRGIGSVAIPANRPPPWGRPRSSAFSVHVPAALGIRVSDPIEYARNILERYEGPGAPPRVLTVSHEHPWRWRESNRPKRRCKSRRQRCLRSRSREITVSAIYRNRPPETAIWRLFRALVSFCVASGRPERFGSPYVEPLFVETVTALPSAVRRAECVVAACLPGWYG
jgi:hypothetical protein